MKGTPAPLHRSTKAGSSGLVTLRGVFPHCGRVSETPSVPGQDLEVNNQVPPTLSRSRRQRGFSLWEGPAGIAVQARHGTALSRQKYRRCCTRALLYTSKRSPSKNGWSFPHTSSQRQGHLHSKKTGAEDHESADNVRPEFLLCPHSARCGVSTGSNELWRSTVLAPRLQLLNPAIGKPGHRVQSRTALSGPACATTRTNARRPTQHGAELLELAILHHGERKVSRSNELTNLQLESLQLFCIHGP